ncbi:hypothetical protein PVK06_039082 [Gossypium arboreum]|uniref:Uncharacterized protein n=1 Tax=Gossypium arboreum TaxID=29729 RepID=A0ABR0N1Z2_GOSAR|nr:hypothetical protein PVK06_039082 [Gossypium arboreum]
MLLQKFKEHGWDPLFEKVKLFCKNHEMEVLNIDSLLTEINSHFTNKVVKLLALSFALDPRDNYKAFRVENICKNYSSCANSSHVYCNNKINIFSHENYEDKASQ